MRIEEVSTKSAEVGIAWPVVIIGGLVILAGLYALRGEFGNFRRRRAERRDTRPSQR